jgi:opacity protein-like surface antigen
MKSFVAGVFGILALSGTAYAQPPADATGYVAGVAQSAFGNVTSQSFGIEGGWFYTPRLAVFVELGGMRDTAPSTIGPAAQVIASYLGTVQNQSVTYSVKQPVAFAAVGARYTVAERGAFHPYGLFAVGAARVTRDVAFTVGGSDVTATLESYGVTLGTDLAGSTTKPMFTFGGGVAWMPRGAWQFDLGYRFSRISTEPTGTSVSRLGVAIGYRF